ncbi:hypothetical protein EAG18_00200 [Pseudoalteromonas sp. J010]|uniref:hypothetical protein n=1 Tax=Pseudoalteromonas sp. J010 TaxID=998465 RepID=UPI000F64B3C2|nr:hypothetical protein [Pseudoalteromonas sp. J010]RRS10493.1 hypothetical protein EAG18_00200 [Pseudoalteromonas sp. J010]
MKAIIQFPIADARPFSPTLNLRRAVPDFPDPVTEITPQFVHHFGEARERTSEPDEAWPDELKFVTAKRAIQFHELEKYRLSGSYANFKLKCTYRRLFNDGWAVVRTEIGFSIQHRKKIKHNRTNYCRFSINDVLSIAQDICQLPTLVFGKNGQTTKSGLILQGKHLAKNYALASQNRTNSAADLSLPLVEACNPLILIELENEEASLAVTLEQTAGIVKVDEKNINGAKLFYCKLNVRKGCISTWILQKGTASNSQIRSLRMCLSRIHAEREVLDSILRQIKRGELLNKPSEFSVDKLDEYFNKRIKFLDRKSWYGIDQSEIINAIEATQKVVRKASNQQLISRYEGSRRQVFEKVRRYQERRNAHTINNIVKIKEGAIMVDKSLTIGGDGNIVNIAENMENVTNSVNNNFSESIVDKNIEGLVKQLHEEIHKISQEVNPSTAKKLARNAQSISDEITSEEPDKRWFELSLTGIKECAETLGSIANPILNIAQKLAPLLK